MTTVDTESDVNSNAGCLQVASLIRDKTPEEVREIFNIENDFSDEEKVRVGHKYCGSNLTRRVSTGGDPQRE